MTLRVIREDFIAPVARIVRRVDGAIEQMSTYGDSPAWRDAVSAVLALSRAPKHLVRAQLVLLGSLVGGGAPSGERIERFAAGVELLHLFMLVHDDVMDNATRRRGRPALRVAIQAADPSIGWLEARDLAVIMGNMLNVLAMQHLLPGAGATAGEEAACSMLLEACCRAGAGQFHDLLGFRRLGGDEAALRREIIDKTAYQAFAAPLAAGLILARAEADTKAAIAWGCSMGLALQTLDDLTDLVAPPALTGKDGLRNLLEGRPSLPLLLLHARTTGEDRDFLEATLGKKSMEFGERARLADLIKRYDIVEGCASWIRAEVAAAGQPGAAESFTNEAREGMAVVEQSLLEHLEEAIKEVGRGLEEE
jgi:geranylgeranyl diphosphate synthase type I